MKRYLCIVFTDFHITKVYPFQNLSLEFIILKVFLRFRKFQPRYSYKIYSCRKKKSVLYYFRSCSVISCCRYQFSSFSISNLPFTTTIITVCLINSTIVFLLVRPWGWPYYNYLRLTLTRYCCGDSLLATTSPGCFRSVPFSLTRKPLLSVWSYMYLVNKNYGKDYPLAREDIRATNTYMTRWFQSKEFESSAIYQIWSCEFLLAYSLFFNKCWEVSISWTFFPILREFEVRLK